MARLDSVISLAFSRAHPKLLSQEEVARLDAEERKAHAAKRFKLSGVPVRYKDARLEDCPDSVKAYAEAIHDSKHGPWLVISGPNGTGKTHCACAVLNAENEHGVKFTTMHQILDEAWSDKSALQRYENCRILVIDDFGKDKPSEYNVSQFFAILNARYDMQKPTVITTNYSSEELAKYLTVGDNHQAARAIVDRILERGNHFVRLEGRSRRW